MANLQSLTVDGKSLLDWLHPVGSIYTSTDPTSPEELFGGTWESIIETDTEPRFLRYSNPNATNEFKLDSGTKGGKVKYVLRATIGAADSNTASLGYIPCNVNQWDKYKGAYAVIGDRAGTISERMNHHTSVYDFEPTTEYGIKPDWANPGIPTVIIPTYTTVYGWKRIS